MIEIILDLPPKELHPNARPHRWAKAKATKSARQYACLVAKQSAPPKPLTKARYDAVFYLPRKRDYDGLTAWLKAYIDGIQDAGIIANDSELHPHSVTRFSGAAVTGKHRVVIKIHDETLLANICHACMRPLEGAA